MDINEIRKTARDMGELERSVERLSNPLAFSSARQVADQMEYINRVQRDIAEAREAPTARRAVQQIASRIQEFEATLDAASEIGMKLVSFGVAMTVHIREVGYEQPNLIFFRGHVDDGSPVELIQHQSQLNFLLVRVKRLEPEKPRAPIGFHLGD